MPALTRRYSPDHPDCWHVYYGDVDVGTIARRTGCPHDADQWKWTCGFYPGMHPGDQQLGTGETFEACRIEFESAWHRILPTITEADFQEWRDQREWTARKYAMWERGERMPTQLPNSMMRCPCGARFDSHRLEESMVHVPHITAAQAADGIRR